MRAEADGPILMSRPEPNQDKATVLVIEDCPEVQRYLRLLLELDYYQVEVASSGEEALERMHQGSIPELVLLDMQMPGMDGLKTLECLRDLQPDLKVIICSGEDHPDTIQQAILLGAQAYLVKPVPRLYLSAAVEGCLSRRRSQTATAIVARPSIITDRLN
ncbi:MAG TPA: response regulator [Terriglobales bacterium]|nr:response regulator [Terriglobales bacterium]